MDKFILDCLEKLKKFSNPELELRILLNKSLVKKKEIILSNFNIEDINLIKFSNYFDRRISNEPISKIFNSKSFWKYDFYVTSDVLDPRPETELIIENVLKYFQLKNKKLKILDICTGSGCIAISIAKEYLNARVYGTDISTQAIKIAKINAKKLNCHNQINFIKCDMVNMIEKFDIVICNPPYLSDLEYSETSLGIRFFEPKIALVALDDGYEFYNRISGILPKILNKKSLAFIEIGSSQAKKAISIFRSKGINCLELVKDIQNLDRLLILNKS